MGQSHSWRLVRFGISFHLIGILVCLLLSTAPATFDEDAQILWSFRNEIDNNSSGVAEQWFSTWTDLPDGNPNPCVWIGVTCTANHNVEGLDFSGWGLDPRMPSLHYLSNLKDLRRLDLSSNSAPFRDSSNSAPYWATIHDAGIMTMPDGIGNLTGLTYLDLSGNDYEGEIQGNISNCQNLQYLFLEDNLLEGGISTLAGMTSLTFLDLANNRLNDSLSFGEMPRLVYMDLSNNRLTGSLSNASKFPVLQFLNLDNNDFTEIEDSFFDSLSSLQIVSIAVNQLRGGIPPSLANLSGPTKQLSVNLSNNQLSGQLPSWYSPPTTLDLSQNMLSGSIPPPLLNLNCRNSVNLSYNSFTGNITSAEVGVEPEFYCVTGPLDVSHNQLSGSFPGSFSVQDGLPPVWDNYFLFNDNQLSGDIVDFLVGIAQNATEDLGIVAQMYLQNNKFSGDMSRVAVILEARTPASLWNSLEVLDLSNNNLGWRTSETIPDTVSVLLENLPENLTELRVGGNNFAGISLPNELQSGNGPRNLQVLDLSNNHLEGQISSAVFSSAGLPSLKTLNLSNNKATGQIPSDINSLQNLTVFDVSNNNLSGSLSFIQPGSPLYNPNFFAGNSRLCDGPLPPCKNNSGGISGGRSGLPLWVVFVIAGPSATIVMGSCLVAAWRWRVYNRRHQQDAELIKTLLEGESATIMSLRELKTATNNFAESAQIGEGGFGKVYRGQLKDGTIVAIKKSKREGYEKDKQQFLNEVRILTQLNHRHLVKLLGCCMENKVAVLVFEFVANGTLKEHLQRKCGAPNLSWKQRLNIAVQTADALNYLHSAATVPIYHRDVKSANILLNGDLNAKVADFGISKLVPVEATHVSTMAVQGTIGYMDPEYYTSLKLTDKSDVYGFGVVLLELISAKPAIDFQRGTEESSLVIFAKPHIESEDLNQLIDPSLLETYLDTTGQGRESISSVGRLAMQCLNMRSKSRPSMQEVWQELQNLWLLLLQIEGTSQQLESINEDSTEDPQHNFRNFLPSNSLFEFSSFTIQCKTRSIEMSQFSR